MLFFFVYFDGGWILWFIFRYLGFLVFSVSLKGFRSWILENLYKDEYRGIIVLFLVWDRG